MPRPAPAPRRSSLTPFYVILGLVALAAAGLLGTKLMKPASKEGANQGVAVTLTPDQLQNVHGISVGRADAPITIYEFADFQCPHCRDAYFGLKPVFDKYTADAKDVTFIFRTWPLNSNCNPSVPMANFVATCDASALYIMAKRKGTGDTLKDWFFLHQSELSPDTVRQAATDVAKVPDFQAGYAKAIQEVKTDAAVGTSLNIHSTPSFFINGRALPAGAIAPQYMDSLIQLELSRAK